jgi:hypothetical protein
MFKNRAAQVTFVKTPKSDTETTKTTRRYTDAEITMIKSAAKNVGVYLLGSAVALKFTSAICTIAINAAPKK